MLAEHWLAVDDAEDEEMLVLEAMETFGLYLDSFRFSIFKSITLIESFDFFSLLIEFDELFKGGFWVVGTWELVNERSWLAMSLVSWLNDSFKSISVCWAEQFADCWLLPVLEEIWFVVVLWACMSWEFGGEFCLDEWADLTTKKIRIILKIYNTYIEHALEQNNIKNGYT